MTPRYKLRTLLLLLAILPPLLAVGWWQYSAWRAEQARREAHQRLLLELHAEALGGPSYIRFLVPVGEWPEMDNSGPMPPQK